MEFTHQQVLIALMVVDFTFDDKYKKILTEDDFELVSQIEQFHLFGE